MSLASRIVEANIRGYAVKFKREFRQFRITCIYYDNTSHSSLLPQDHMVEETLMEVIDHNIKVHRQRMAEK